MPKLLTTKSPKRPMSGKMEIVFSAHASVANATVSVSICSRDTNARLGFRECYLVYYWRHQTITWINLDWASISRFCGIHMGSRKHSWYQSVRWVCKVHSKISTASPHSEWVNVKCFAVWCRNVNWLLGWLIVYKRKTYRMSFKEMWVELILAPVAGFLYCNTVHELHLA